MRLFVLTQPTSEPVSLAEVKAALRIDDTRFDTVLPGLITAARAIAEQETGLRLMQQVVRCELDDWPDDDDDLVPVPNPTAVAVSWWNGSGWTTMGAGTFVYFAAGTRTAVVPALYTTWPALAPIAGGPRVRIDVTAGETSAATVPAGVKTFITALVGQLVQSPDLAPAAALEANPMLGMLLAPWKVYG